MTLAATGAIKGLFHRCHYEDLGSRAHGPDPGSTDPLRGFGVWGHTPIWGLMGTRWEWGIWAMGPGPYSLVQPSVSLPMGYEAHRCSTRNGL